MKPVLHIACLLLAARLMGTTATAQTMPGNDNNTKKQEVNMNTTQANKATVQKLYEEALNKRHFQLLHDLIADDFTGIQGKKGAAGFEAPVRALIAAFPDIQWKLEDLLADGDKVVVRWQWQGTHKAPYTGYAPTGKTITNEGMAIFTLMNGKITGSQVQTDRLGFLQAIDVVPADPSTLLKSKPNNGQEN